MLASCMGAGVRLCRVGFPPQMSVSVVARPPRVPPVCLLRMGGSCAQSCPVRPGRGVVASRGVRPLGVRPKRVGGVLSPQAVARVLDHSGVAWCSPSGVERGCGAGASWAFTRLFALVTVGSEGCDGRVRAVAARFWLRGRLGAPEFPQVSAFAAGSASRGRFHGQFLVPGPAFQFLVRVPAPSPHSSPSL